MRIHLGCDHAGYALKLHLIDQLRAWGHEPIDHGPDHDDPHDDYPPFVIAAAQAVAGDSGSLGVVIGGSGNGEQIAANKVVGVRAALVWNTFTAVAAREHNNANVMSLGARLTEPEVAWQLLQRFISTAFTEEPRHTRRIAMITSFERTGQAPVVIPPEADANTVSDGTEHDE